jgi:phosphatidylglycerophosphate synthase
MSGHLLSTANVISLGRALMGPVVLALLFVDTPLSLDVALALALVAAASDFVDGYMARRSAASEAGRYLDAACDALFYLAVFLGFLANRWIAPSWFAAIYFAEIIVPYLGTFTKQIGRPFAVRWSARLKTALHPLAQIAVIAAAAFDWPNGGAHSWAAQAALGLAVLASLAYLVDHAVLAARRVTQRA